MWYKVRRENLNNFLVIYVRPFFLDWKRTASMQVEVTLDRKVMIHPSCAWSTILRWIPVHGWCCANRLSRILGNQGGHIIVPKNVFVNFKAIHMVILQNVSKSCVFSNASWSSWAGPVVDWTMCIFVETIHNGRCYSWFPTVDRFDRGFQWAPIGVFWTGLRKQFALWSCMCILRYLLLNIRLPWSTNLSCRLLFHFIHMLCIWYVING